MNDSFRGHVFLAIGTGVPCRRPFAGIKLLQLIGHDQVDRFFRSSQSLPEDSLDGSSSDDDHDVCLDDNGECLVDPGTDNADTLISVMKDSNLKHELEDLVKDTVEQHVVTLIGEEKDSLEQMIPAIFLKCVEDVEARMRNTDFEIVMRRDMIVDVEFAKLRGGFAMLMRTSAKRDTQSTKGKQRLFDFMHSLRAHNKFMSKCNMSWSVSIGSDVIRRRAVSHHKLRKFLRSPDLDLDLKRHMGVVTAIYFVSGGLTFKGIAKGVRDPEVNSLVTNDDIAEGWHCTVTETGTVVVKENNPMEWIVAVEYRDLAIGKKDAELRRRQLILIDPPVS